jgi:class 3 adenylate cyclase
MKKLILIVCFLYALVANAQNRTIDSLQQVLKNFEARRIELKELSDDESDTAKVNILKKLSLEYSSIADYDGAIKYADEALAISQQINFRKGAADSYYLIGNIHIYQSNYPEALKNHFASLKIREEIGNKNDIAFSFNSIGYSYFEQGNYPEALKNHFASLKLREEIGDRKGIAMSYINIGNIYDAQENYPEALKNYFASLKIKEEIGDKNGIAICYNNIGHTYTSQGNYPEALKNHLASLKIKEETGNKKGIAMSYYNIGFIYMAQGNYPEALKYHLASLKIMEETGNKIGIAGSCIRIGSIKVKMQNALEGKEWLAKGLSLSKETGSKDLIIECYQVLAEADSAMGDFKGAYQNHKQYILYRDSVLNEENTKKTVQTNMQYEFDKKEAETKALTDAELKKQKLLRNGFVGGFAVVLLFATVFFYQRNKTKKEKRKSDKLLLNILPAEVASELKTSGSSKAKSFTMVTVMFTDFKDFTTVSEKISAELLVDEIHHCFSVFDNVVQKYKIEKIKTIGDAYLCASGLPVSNYTHALDMIHAAFEIRDFMLQRKKEKEAKGEIPFELRIGIHTGPVVAGIVGVKKYAYDIWGDTVNISARMEQNSEAGKINISGATYELVKDKFNCIHRGKISAKNKGEIDMYFVERSFSEV